MRSQQQLHSFFQKKKRKEEEHPKKKQEVQKKKQDAEKENNTNNNNTNDGNNNDEVAIQVPDLPPFVMGCKSQDRKSAIQRAKERTYSIQNALREAKSKNQKIKTKNPQRKLDGTIAEPRCNDPDSPRECLACTKTAQYEARGKTFKGFAHHYSCPHNKDYLDNLFGPKSASAKKQEAEAKRIAKKNSEPLPAPDLKLALVGKSFEGI